MGRVLVVVESPAKARTIKKYLGKDYRVEASVGHVRDLPKKELGIDIENNFQPRYVRVRGKGKVIKQLRKAMEKSDRILLATDMDREGEAIAWHLKDILSGDSREIKRIIFNEITETALKDAVANPLDIDDAKVNAQQARRILDRLVGYLVSPILWRIFFKGLSAGRVQSVGLRLLVEREKEIREFVPEEYWTIQGKLASPGEEEFETRLFKVDGKKPSIDNEELCDQILKDIKSEQLKVKSVRQAEKKRNPYPPYITSTLQRDAAARLGFSAKKTMVVAQQLYEGVEMGKEGSAGLISYMRTDSTRVSGEAYRDGVSCIKKVFGNEYVHSGKRSFRKKKGTQDAHECIRPTDSFRTPEQAKPFLNKGQYALYNLIWQRFLASLASPAVYQTRRADISAGSRYLLRSSGRRLKFKGFLAIMPDRKREEESWIPDIKEGDRLSIIKLDKNQHFTEPPPRYTEGSLVKELEDKGIGRPSTYASIISIIQYRKYATKRKATLYPTRLGEDVWNILSRLFSDIFAIDFTARMESELDKVEEREKEWQEVVKYFYQPLTSDIEKANHRKDQMKELVQEETDEVCEKCGRKMVIKWSRNGRFLACTGWPECKFSRSINEKEIDKKCPRCGGQLVFKDGRFGRFVACKNYPECRYTEPVKIGLKCPVKGCGGDIIERKSRRGKIFYGCSNYPKCKYANWDRPTDRICPNCGNDYLVEKHSSRKGDYLKCNSCKAEIQE